jgi:hypothetical protein
MVNQTLCTDVHPNAKIAMIRSSEMAEFIALKVQKFHSYQVKVSFVCSALLMKYFLAFLQKHVSRRN